MIVLYAAKCFWPGVTEAEFTRFAIRRLRGVASHETAQPTYMGSLVFVADELVLCVFRCISDADARRAADAAGVPCERIMPLVWSPRPERQPTAERERSR